MLSGGVVWGAVGMAVGACRGLSAATRHKYQVPVKRSFLKPRLHARVEQIVLNCNVFKTLFRSARLGRVGGSASARSAETTTTSDVAET